MRGKGREDRKSEKLSRLRIALCSVIVGSQNDNENVESEAKESSRTRKLPDLGLL